MRPSPLDAFGPPSVIYRRDNRSHVTLHSARGAPLPTRGGRQANRPAPPSRREPPPSTRVTRQASRGRLALSRGPPPSVRSARASRRGPPPPIRLTRPSRRLRWHYFTTAERSNRHKCGSVMAHIAPLLGA